MIFVSNPPEFGYIRGTRMLTSDRRSVMKYFLVAILLFKNSHAPLADSVVNEIGWISSDEME